MKIRDKGVCVKMGVHQMLLIVGGDLLTSDGRSDDLVFITRQIDRLPAERI
jgi:hypothetical protein